MVRIWSVRLCFLNFICGDGHHDHQLVSKLMVENRFGLEVCEHEIEMQKKYLVGRRMF